MRKTDLVRLAGHFGLYSIARFVSRNHTRILMYHRFSRTPESGHVSLEKFEQQIQHILKNYTPVTMNTLANQLSAKAPMKANQIAITVDDGYLDFYEIAFPVLKRLGVPATLFVTSGFADNRLWLWPDKVSWLLEQTVDFPKNIFLGSEEIQSGPMSTEKIEFLWGKIGQYLLSISDVDKYHWIDSFSQKLRITLPDAAPPKFAPANWEQLREMQSAGIEIGGHTVTHPSLGRVESSDLVREVNDSLNEINSQLGVRPRPFCYPNGTINDYSLDAMQVVKNTGYTCAVVAFADALNHSSRFALRRHTGADDMFQFMKSVSGLEWLGNKLKGSIHEPN